MAPYDSIPTSSEDLWGVLKSTLIKTTEEVCGWTKKKNFRRETWWWDDGVSKVVGEKRRIWKAWKKGNASKDEYLLPREFLSRLSMLLKR